MLLRGGSTMITELSIINWAEQRVTPLLTPLGNRWLHTKGVVARARHVSRAFDEEDRATLIAAAYLHDIGYAPSLNTTDFHPIDGANYLLQQGQIRLASLVAYHSEAQYEAALRGLSNDLNRFSREYSIIADALTYCDMTTSSIGLQISFEERLTDIFQRHDETDIVNQAIHQAISSLTQTITRTQNILTF